MLVFHIKFCFFRSLISYNFLLYTKYTDISFCFSWNDFTFYVHFIILSVLCVMCLK